MAHDFPWLSSDYANIDLFPRELPHPLQFFPLLSNSFEFYIKIKLFEQVSLFAFLISPRLAPQAGGFGVFVFVVLLSEDAGMYLIVVEDASLVD